MPGRQYVAGHRKIYSSGHGGCARYLAEVCDRPDSWRQLLCMHWNIMLTDWPQIISRPKKSVKRLQKHPLVKMVMPVETNLVIFELKDGKDPQGFIASVKAKRISSYFRFPINGCALLPIWISAAKW